MKELLKDSKGNCKLSISSHQSFCPVFMSTTVLFSLPPLVPVFFSFFCSHHLSLPLPLCIYTQSLEHKIPQRHAFPCQNTQALSPRKKFLPYIIHQRGGFSLWSWDSHARLEVVLLTHTHTHTSKWWPSVPDMHLCCFTHSHWPRSEHWTTRSWQWQPKGHMGMSGGRISSTAEPSSSSLIIVIMLSMLSMLSMAKSQKPLCSKGRAEEGESSRTTHSSSRTEQCGSIFNWETRGNTKRKHSRVSCLLYINVNSLQAVEHGQASKRDILLHFLGGGASDPPVPTPTVYQLILVI